MMILPHFTDVKMTWSVASCKVTLPYNSKDISTMFDTTQYFRKWRSLHEKKKKNLLIFKEITVMSQNGACF